MNDPRHQLTPEVQEQICNLVRAGGFPQVAAEAVGIPAHVFNRWMSYGSARRPQPIYRDFAEAVRQAQAQARIVAESQALRKAPLSWLRYGPGKESNRMPGWTDAVKPARRERSGRLGLGKLQEVITALLAALEPFPEARAAAAESLSTLQWLQEANEENPPQVPVEAKPAPMPEPPPPVVAEEPAPAPPSVEEKQPESAPEPAEKPQETVNPAATNPQAKDSEPAVNQEVKKSETAGNPPSAEVKQASPPPRRERSIWERFNDYPWTVIWRSGD